MKMKTMTRTLMAVAMLFAVQTNASAQLGGLMKKAKNAAEKTVKGAANGGNVATEASSNAAAEQARADYEKEHPAIQEKRNAEKAGGMDKYLGLDQTENGRILWKYANLTSDEYTGGQNIRNAFEAARQLTFILRYLKGNTEEFSAHAQPAYVLDMVNNQIPANIKRARESKGVNLPKGDIDAIAAELPRIKQLYLSQTGTKEKTAGEKQAEADAEYIKSVQSQNYLLKDLRDKNPNAKVVADYKSKFNAKVKSALAPTKILATYSSSVAWQGLPVFTMPEYKDTWSSIQEMQFKTFYEKDGKYYVVEGGFRHGIKKSDNAQGKTTDWTDYWPGLKTPVEIPADKIQGVKF